MKSDRHIDMGADSRAISPFLDENFYSQMVAQYGVICSRVHDKERQYKGIDVEILARADQAYVDEKVKIDNINNPPSAISFELSSVQGGVRRDGWFIGNAIETTHYLIGGVFSKNTDKRTLEKSDIDYISATMVAKHELKSWLSSFGVTDEYLRTIDADLREHPEKYRVRQDERKTFRVFIGKTDKVWLTYSAWLSESPINLVVPKAVLDTLPRSRRYVVSRNGFVEIGYPITTDILYAKMIWGEETVSSAMERIAALEERMEKVAPSEESDIPY